jgi:hypothetical protein
VQVIGHPKDRLDLGANGNLQGAQAGHRRSPHHLQNGSDALARGRLHRRGRYPEGCIPAKRVASFRRSCPGHKPWNAALPRNPREPAAWSPPHAAGNIHHRPPPSPTRISGEEVPISRAFLWPVARARTAPSARCCTVTMAGCWATSCAITRTVRRNDGPAHRRVLDRPGGAQRRRAGSSGGEVGSRGGR